MPAITGNVKDIVDASMSSKVAKLVFYLSDPSVQATGSSAGTIHPTAEREVVPASDGSFTVNLVRTDTMLNDAWFIVRIEWNEPTWPARDFPEWQIRVNSSGKINEKIYLAPPSGGWGGPMANLSLVLVALTKPDNLQVGQLWLQAAPEQHASANPALNTGQLWRGK